MIKLHQIDIKDNIQDAFDEFKKPYLYHNISIHLIFNHVYLRGSKVIVTNK